MLSTTTNLLSNSSFSFPATLLEKTRSLGEASSKLFDLNISSNSLLSCSEEFKIKSISGRKDKNFAFTQLMRCGLCNSGVTAEEKYKHRKDGTTKNYIYYGRTRFYDRNCKNTYLREDELISQLLDIVDKIDLNLVGVKQKLEQEMSRFGNFRNKVLGLNEGETKEQGNLDLRSYVKYLLKDGTLEEKRELMRSFKSNITLINKKILVD